MKMVLAMAAVLSMPLALSGCVQSTDSGADASSSTVEASPVTSPVTDEVAPPSEYPGLPISFQFQDGDGWRWKMSLAQLPSIYTELSTSNSPPGKATLHWNLGGSFEGELVSLDNGRTPPEREFSISFEYQEPSAVAPVADFQDTGVSFRCSGWRRIVNGNERLHAGCQYVGWLGSESGANLGVLAEGLDFISSVEGDEATISEAASAYAAQNLDRLWISGSGCAFEVEMAAGNVKAINADYADECTVE